MGSLWSAVVANASTSGFIGAALLLKTQEYPAEQSEPAGSALGMCCLWHEDMKAGPTQSLKKPALMSGAFGLTIQQLRSKAWVLHEPFRAFSRVANTRLCPQLPEFLLGHPFDFVLHFTLCFPCESPRWRFLVWAGVEKEMQREAACAAHLPPAMAGRAGGGTRSPSHAISCSRPLLRCHFGQGDGSGGAQSRFWNSSTSRASLIPWNCARILQKGFMRIFFKMFVFKILIKERQGVQLLAHCCAGLMKDQHVDTQAF